MVSVNELVASAPVNDEFLKGMKLDVYSRGMQEAGLDETTGLLATWSEFVKGQGFGGYIALVTVLPAGIYAGQGNTKLFKKVVDYDFIPFDKVRYFDTFEQSRPDVTKASIRFQESNDSTLGSLFWSWRSSASSADVLQERDRVLTTIRGLIEA